MIKKFSLLTLTFISFLFVGMMLPSVHATEETVSLTLNVVKLEDNQVKILPATVDIQFGQTASLDLSGLESDGAKIALLHNDTFVANDQEFLLSGSLNVSVIIKNDATDIVAAFVDSNGELLDVVYNPEEAPTTLAQPTKPGYEVGTFTTTEITSDTVFVANYVRSLDTPITVEVVGGTKDKETYLFNDIVTVDADLEGFTHWEDKDGNVVSYKQSFKFSALEDITLTAKTGGTESDHIYIRDVSGIRSNYNSLVGYLDSNNFIEYGFITSKDADNDLTLDSSNVIKMPSKSLNNLTNEFLRSIPETEDFVTFRGYGIKDNGEVVYSNVILYAYEVTLNVMLPENTPDGDIYFASVVNDWSPNNDEYKFNRNEYEASLNFFIPFKEIDFGENEYYDMMYKLTRGSWDNAEDLPYDDTHGFNRNYRIFKDHPSKIQIEYSLVKWADIEEFYTNITFIVTDIQGDGDVYLVGDFEKFGYSDWNTQDPNLKMNRIGNMASITLSLKVKIGESIEYKYTKGDWDSAEYPGEPNRVYSFSLTSQKDISVSVKWGFR